MTSSIQYFSINRRDGKRWSLGLLLALIFYNSICWLSSKILQGRNCKSVYVHNRTIKLSLSPGIPWSAWTKHICLAARKKMTGHQSWKGHRFLCVFCVCFYSLKPVRLTWAPMYICASMTGVRKAEPTGLNPLLWPQAKHLCLPLSLLHSESGIIFYLKYIKYKALTTEVVGFHPLYKSI